MKLFNKTIWAITPEMLRTMMSLAKENNKPPETINQIDRNNVVYDELCEER